VSVGDNNSGAVAGSFTLSAQLPNGKSLTFSGYVLQGESRVDIDTKLDVAALVVERQRLAAEVPELEKKLEQYVQAREQVETIIAELTAHEKLTSTQKQQLNTMRVNLKKIDGDIEKGKAAIAEAKKATAQRLAA
jgi:septal ring factor EnvC (AmiA/AmiB activator)